MNLRPYKALILDDEYFLGDILAKALEDEGINSIAVTNVDTAIRTLENDKFDIVVSDIYLPEKTGHDLFKYALEHHPDLPFIFITGNPTLETAVDFLKQGAYDYLPKPFMLPELVYKVKEVISESKKRHREKHLVKDLKEMLEKRSEDFRVYQDVFNSKKDGLLILDMDGVIAQVNPGFERMSGIKESALLNKPLSVLGEGFFFGIDFKEIQQSIAQTGQWKKELKAKRRSGESWTANFSFFPVQNEEGETFAYSAIISDVTSLRRVEKALIGAQEAIIFGLARLAEYRDRETGYHLERIRSYSKELALALRDHPRFGEHITDSYIENLHRTAPLHDIGKVGIPDRILLKDDKLTDEEYEIMKSHTMIGYHTLNSIRKQYGEMEFLNMGIEITYSHHERYDGKGYPQGLQGDEIPLSAQIVAIADVYDALTSERVYKRAFSHQETVTLMKLERGGHFAPELFDIFLEVADRFDAIRQEFHTREKAYPDDTQELFRPFEWRRDRETA